MFYKAAILTVSIAIASPALANDRFAERLGLEPGVYTTNELVQIMNTPAGDRPIRIELINKQRAAFDAAVRRLMATKEGL